MNLLKKRILQKPYDRRVAIERRQDEPAASSLLKVTAASYTHKHSRYRPPACVEHTHTHVILRVFCQTSAVFGHFNEIIAKKNRVRLNCACARSCSQSSNFPQK